MTGGPWRGRHENGVFKFLQRRLVTGGPERGIQVSPTEVLGEADKGTGYSSFSNGG